MGHAYSQIRGQHLPEEFEKAKRLHRGDRDYLVLDQVLQIPNTNWESHAPDFSHLATLYMLDQRKNGKFYLEEFLAFADLCKERDDLYRKIDYISNFKAYCTLVMWTEIGQEGGIDHFVNWYEAATADGVTYPTRFCSVFTNNTVVESATMTFDRYPGLEFVSYDTVKTMHQILNIRESYGIPFQDFFATCMRASREKALATDDDEDLEEYVLLSVIAEFSKNFATGFVNLMLELGFDPNMDPDVFYE